MHQSPYPVVRSLSVVPVSLLLAFALPIQAQSDGYMSSHPVMKALDVDCDGTLSAQEIDNAAVTLKFLDDDGDGALSRKELRGSGWDDWGDMDDWSDWGEMDDWGDRPGRSGDSGAAKLGVLKPAEVDAKDGTDTIPDRATFKKLSYKEGMVMPHLKGQEFVKFQIEGAGTEAPRLYFVNTETHPTHMTFMRTIGGRARGGMRGVLVRRPLLMAPNGEPGVFTFEFDLPEYHPFERIKLAYDLLQAKAPLLRDRLVYHPMRRAVDQHRKDAEEYESVALPVILTEQLYTNVGFLPLHMAESFGRLRLMSPQERPSPRDIVVCQALPNEMPRVAGIVSGALQTPLSHVNLRAIQDDVPNAFIQGGADNDVVRPLIGKYVFYKVTEDGFEIREASVAEVNSHFAAARPRETQVPERDLSVTKIRPLDRIGFGDSSSVGVKAANLATLGKLGFSSDVVPQGFAVPFHFYDAFMKHNGLYESVEAMRNRQGFQEDTDVREKALAELRREIENGRVPAWMEQALGELQQSFPSGTSLRCRSSTNNEDLPGFSGAGLYDSYTHRIDEGHLAKSIKEVYASLWNSRAYEEREFSRVDHFATAMGVLIHPNFPDELANGVAVTEDVAYQTEEQKGRMYYINTQVGDDLVTNPEAESIPEELLLSPRFPCDDVIVRRSNRVEREAAILDSTQLTQLRLHLKTIHREFRKLYGKSADAQFAMEIEFKVTSDGSLVIKQTRPWVF